MKYPKSIGRHESCRWLHKGSSGRSERDTASLDFDQRQLIIYSERQLREDVEGQDPVDEEDVVDGAEENAIVIVDNAKEDPITNQNMCITIRMEPSRNCM